MGFGDKLKGLKDQAQQAVAENKDKIQDAVQVAGQVANTKTHGKYATKIAKVGERVESSVDKFAEGDGSQSVEETDSAAAPIVQEPADPVSASAADTAAAGFPDSAPAPSGEPPAFEPHDAPSEPAAAPSQSSHSAPDFE